MPVETDASETFSKRFVDRAQAERYRDRYRTGRRVRIDRLERAALRYLLGGLGYLDIALDVPGGTGRLTPVLAEFADRVILADASAAMLDLAREELSGGRITFLETDARHMALDTASVDLVFCHRYLHHIHEPEARACVFRELARVSRRYAIISYYTPGTRDYGRWLRGSIIGHETHHRPLNRRRFIEETAAAGLRFLHGATLRRVPVRAEFCLFDHGD